MNGWLIGKSQIQRRVDDIERISKLKTLVRGFVDKYDTDNMIFGLRNGKPDELVSGYMNIDREYQNLEDALSDISYTNQAVQILGREGARTYRVGRVLPIEQCNGTIVDIHSLRQF